MPEQEGTTESHDITAANLGPIVAEYFQKAISPRMNVVFVFAWSLIGFALIWAGQDLGFPLGVEDVFLVLFCIGCSVLGLGLTAAFLWIKKLHSGDWVVVCERGLVQRFKGRQVICAWDDIEKAYCGELCKGWRSIRSRHPYYRLKTYGGDWIEVSSRADHIWWGRFSKDMASLGETIESNIEKTLVPRLVQRFQAGDRTEFGSLSADFAGVYFKHRLMPWSEIKAFSKETWLVNGIGDTEIVLEETGSQQRPIRMAMAKIPNLAALRHMHGLMAPGSLSENRTGFTRPS